MRSSTSRRQTSTASRSHASRNKHVASPETLATKVLSAPANSGLSSPSPAAIARSNASNHSSIIPRYTVGGDHRMPKTVGEGIPGFKKSLTVSSKGGGAFRPISENFTVNQANGTLSLGIPIRTSQTRGGFGPDLNFSYDSGAGNGPFGFGWSLGAPAVQRKSSRSIPVYTDDDELALGGAEIVPSLEKFEYNDTDFNVVRYRPRIDSRDQRIERWTSKHDEGNVYWRTISADNTVNIYGLDDTCRIFDTSGGRKRISTWLLCRSYDARGNAKEYVYKQEDGVGHGDTVWEKHRTHENRCRQKYLKQIKYGNRVSNRDMTTWKPATWPQDWMFTVVFDYGEHDLKSPTLSESNPWLVRKDVFSAANLGFELRNYRLCRRILMFNHFPNELSQVDVLVESTSFKYTESAAGSFLDSLVVTGHKIVKAGAGETVYATESLPPWSFRYTTMPEKRQYKAMKAKAANLLDVPQAGTNLQSEWLDLDGEGIPGLLTKLRNGTMVYQRNNGPDAATQFGAPEVLEQPSLSLGAGNETSRMMDLDRNGRQDLVCSSPSSQPMGFYERDSDSDSWSEYSDFSEMATPDPTLDLGISIDMTGDGTADLLCAEGDAHELIWQKAQGKRGRSGYQRTYSFSSACSSCPPRFSKSTEAFTVTADMTGDGLTDLVEVTGNKITYWPNHGHGSFGAAVEMGNPPALAIASGSEFTPDRVRLIDINGNGTSDIMYLLPDGGANIYYNEAGNTWSEPVLMSKLPRVVSPDSVFTLDLLGQGTACLCWLDPTSPTNTTEIMYFDLMAGTKPNLMCSYDNGVGTETTVTYTSSTKFYLQDKAAGVPWTTRLPSPVHCVTKVLVTDHNTHNSTTAKYAYHNGHYDPVEKEMAGFELTEHWMTERVVLAKDEVYESPTSHSKVWHNVGLPHVDQRRFFTSSSLLQLSASSSLAPGEANEAFQALRGRMVRTETFGLDGSEHQNVPHAIEQAAYDIRQLQPRVADKPGVYQITPREALSYQFERSKVDDGRVEHAIVLRSDDWGNVQETLRVVYSRQAAPKTPSELPADVAKNQVAGNVTLMQIGFTRPVLERDDFRKPVPWRQRECEILNSDLPRQCLLSVDEMRKSDFEALPETKTSSAWKAVRSEQRAFFMSSDLQSPLPGGEMQAYSILDRTLSLALTPRKVSKMQQGLDRCGVKLPLDDLLEEGGYVQLDEEGGKDLWWSPSSRASFGSLGDEDRGATRLQSAKDSFYTPTIFEDAFGNRTWVAFDDYFVLAERMRNAAGDEIVFENDYARLQPFRLTDENKNVYQNVFDPLGRGIASALLGKEGVASPDSDSLDDFVPVVSAEDVASLLVDPVSVGRRLLAGAGSRVIWCLDQQPAFAIDLSRNLSRGRSDDPIITVDLTYHDGLGRDAQHVTLHDPEDVSRGIWVVDGLAASGGPGVICAYEPFFAATPSYLPLRELDARNGQMHATVSFYDALGRSVGHVFPDHTWTKAIATPWLTTEYDKADTVLISDPRHDTDVGAYFSRLQSPRYQPSWYDIAAASNDVQLIRAAEKSKTYSDCPVTVHLGNCGLPIRSVHHANGDVFSQGKEYDVSGNKIRDFDTLGRLSQECVHDHLQRRLCISGMDSGEKWELAGADGNAIASWNSRGVGFRYTYDQLRRRTERRSHKGKLIEQTIYGESHLSRSRAESFNLRGEVWRIKDQSGVRDSPAYDMRGRCVKESFRPANEYRETVDWDQVDEETDSEKDEDKFVHRSRFDNFGNTVWEKDAQGNETSRVFSHLGHAVQVDFRHVEDGDATTRYLVGATFAADGLALSQTYGNGTTTTYEYDARSRHLTRHKTILATPRGRATKVLENLVYTYDCAGRRVHGRDTSEEAKVVRGVRVPAENDYTYDAVGRLVAATGRAQPPDASGQLKAHTAASGRKALSNGDGVYKYLETYKYDLAGNILQMRHAAAGLSGWTRRYFYEEQSMLASDKTKGNRLSRTVVGRDTEEYHYDTKAEDGPEEYAYANDAGRMGLMTALPRYSTLAWNCDNFLAASSSQKLTLSESGQPEATYYVYNDAGHRVRKVTTAAGMENRKLKETYYFHGVELQLKANGEKRWTATVGTGHETLARVEHAVTAQGGDGTLVRHQIGQGMELDGAGRLISYEEYSPFGTPVYSAAASGDVQASRAYRFARYRWDSETGLYHCGARYYAAWLGRWTSPDPLDDVDGPNLYQYVLNDPVNLDDPTGTSFNKKKDEGTSPINEYKPIHHLFDVKKSNPFDKYSKDASSTAINIPGDEQNSVQGGLKNLKSRSMAPAPAALTEHREPELQKSESPPAVQPETEAVQHKNTGRVQPKNVIQFEKSVVEASDNLIIEREPTRTVGPGPDGSPATTFGVEGALKPHKSSGCCPTKRQVASFLATATVGSLGGGGLAALSSAWTSKGPYDPVQTTEWFWKGVVIALVGVTLAAANSKLAKLIDPEKPPEPMAMSVVFIEPKRDKQE